MLIAFKKNILNHSIKAKMTLFAVVGVLITIALCIIGASILIYYQTKVQNQERLNSVIKLLIEELIEPIPILDEEYNNFANQTIGKGYDNSTDATIEQAKKLPSFLGSFIGVSKARQEFIKDSHDFYYFFSEFAKQGSMNGFAFYFAKHWNIKTRLRYHDQFSGLFLKPNSISFMNPFLFVDWREQKEPAIFPKENNFTQPYSFRVINNQLILFFNKVLLYEGEPLETINENEIIGNFIMYKYIDILSSGLSLGMKINIYDVHGKMIQGEIPLPNLNLGTLTWPQGVLTLSDANNKQYDSVIEPIQYNGVTAGYLSVSIPQSVTIARIWQTIGVLSLIGVGVLILAIFTTSLFTNKFTQPITKLNEAFEIIASGKLDQYVDTHREDELGKLAKSFSFLQNTILEKMQLIEDYNRTLEQKVMERTKEVLQQKDGELQVMFRNIKQGILTIKEGNFVEEKYSVHLQKMLQTSVIAGTNIMDLLFADSNLAPQTLQYLEMGLSSIIGKEMSAYGSNRHFLINEFEKRHDYDTLILEIDWNPILNENNIIEKMMVILRDVTKIRNLQQEVRAHKKELSDLQKRLETSKEKFDGYPLDISSPNLLSIKMLMPKILYICSWEGGKASEIFLEDIEEPVKSVLPLQIIEDTFYGKLVRTHISYLVNPHVAWHIVRRSSSDYSLEYLEHKIPISRTNYLKIKKIFQKD